jgi:hypothetical protein
MPGSSFSAPSRPVRAALSESLPCSGWRGWADATSLVLCQRRLDACIACTHRDGCRGEAKSWPYRPKMGALLVSRGCHPGLMELALQAGVAGGEGCNAPGTPGTCSARGCWIHSVQEVLTMGVGVFFDPSPPSPLPSKGRGGIEAAFRPEANRGSRGPFAAGCWAELSFRTRSTASCHKCFSASQQHLFTLESHRL